MSEHQAVAVIKSVLHSNGYNKSDAVTLASTIATLYTNNQNAVVAKYGNDEFDALENLTLDYLKNEVH